MAKRIVPQRVLIDASAHCQLACPSCPTASGEVARVLGQGHLDVSNFVALLDGNPRLCEVGLSNYGELFLNPHLPELLRIAWERKVVVTADNGANLNYLSEEALDAMVRYRMRGLSCSIDGATEESYRRYRVKGSLDAVLENIRRINRKKRELRTGFPFLKWQFIVFGHNEHEIAQARKMAAALDMQFVAKLSWDDDASPVRDRNLVQIQTGSGAASRAEFLQITGRDYMRGICAQLWHYPVLNWDGRVTGCCRNFWGEFGGNGFRESLEAVVNSEAMQRARDMLTGRAAAGGDLPCDTCELYHALRRDGRWLEEPEVALPAMKTFCSVVFEARESRVTHVDAAIIGGRPDVRTLVARPPAMGRLDLGRSIAMSARLEPGEYTIYAIPRRLDPAYRQPPETLAPVTQLLQVEERPAVQESVVAL